MNRILSAKPSKGRDASFSKTRSPAQNQQSNPYSKLFSLQRTAGNRAVEQMLHSGTINSVSTGAILQRKCACGSAAGASGKCAKCSEEETLLQRDGTGESESSQVPPIVQEVLSLPGQPLNPDTRSFMEERFGYDFNQVRVHTSTKAAESAKAVNALAYTVGRDVVFGLGQYAPKTSEGRKLIAHELAHVVQQSRGGSAPQLESNASHESSAEEVSNAIVSGQERVSVRGATGIGLARQEQSKLKLVALTPDELMNYMFTLRGFGSSASGASEVDPKGIGKPMGKGYETYAAIQIVDKDGTQVKVGIGAYLGSGKEHGEEQAIQALRRGLPNDANIRGGKMMVVVEQIPCSGCDSAIRKLAQELGIKYEVYIPERPSLTTGQPVTPKTAARTALQGERPPTKAKLIVSENFGGSTGSSTPPATPTNTSPTPKQPTEKQTPKTTTHSASVPGTGEGVRTPQLRGGTSGTAGTGQVSAEMRTAARAAAAEIATDFKLLRAARVLTVATQVIQFISALQMLDEFINMTQNSLAGKGFILSKEIAQAEAMEKKTEGLAKDYATFSDSLGVKQFKFFKAAADPLSAGQAASSLSELQLKLSELQRDLSTHMIRINNALREVEAKQKAAETILNDPKASGAIAAATFGTVELAKLFAVSQDLSRIGSALRSASSSLTMLKTQLDVDLQFVNGWFDSLFSICEKGGVCASKTINVPFIGSSTLRFLPGEASIK